MTTGTNTGARIFYLMGRVEPAAGEVEAELDDGSKMKGDQASGAFVVLYPSERSARAIRLTAPGRTQRCPIQWRNAVPGLGSCSEG